MPRVIRTAAIYATLLLWSAVCLFPVCWMAVTSLKAEADVISVPRYLPFIDFEPTLSSWRFILADPHENLAMRFVNSALVAVSSTMLTMLFGAMAVYGVTRFPRTDALSRAMLPAIIASRILPPIVLVLPIYMMVQFAGLLDTRLALALADAAANLPVAIWLLLPVFGARATEQEEAAQLDGASRVAIFFTIVAPIAAGGLAACGLLIFVLCWNEYLYAAYLATDNAMTVPTWLVGQMSIKEAQVGSEAEEWSHFSAAAILMAAPALAAAMFALKALARTGTAGARLA
jgi:multiple sugar transport system permease protein